MSYLAVQIQDYLAASDTSARQLEERAGLPRMTVGNILNNTRPRPERLGALLRAVDDTTARRWLIAYLRDDCPPEFLPRLEITIAGLPENDSVNEAATTYSVESLNSSPAIVLASWQRLQSAIHADTSLARWFIKTVNLILGPQ